MEVKITKDGSATIYLPLLDEHYHSVNGAITESLHIYIEHGFNYCRRKHIKVFEMGFGTGLNALLTLIESTRRKVRTEYVSIDLYPLNEETKRRLNYTRLIKNGDRVASWFSFLHDCQWNNQFQVNRYFSLFKIHGDILLHRFTGMYDVIYFDAFSPGKQPGIWNRELFCSLYNHMNTGGILTTYSAKGNVKRIMKDAGFFVECLPGPPGKHEFIRAVKTPGTNKIKPFNVDNH